MNFDDCWFIYQHMGLGDHVICNGLIRKLVRPDRKYFLFVKPHNLGSVSYMYRDLTNLHYIQTDDAGVVNFLNHIGATDRLHLIGFNWVDTSKSFEENFYLQNGVSLNEKWDSFRCPRDSVLEEKIYKHYNINEPFVFVHDDNRYRLDQSRLPSEVRIIRPELGLADTIFAYASLIEQAKEIHCMESCFGFMVDNMKLNSNLFMHRYVRNPPKFEIPSYRNVKEILT